MLLYYIYITYIILYIFCTFQEIRLLLLGGGGGGGSVVLGLAAGSHSGKLELSAGTPRKPLAGYVVLRIWVAVKELKLSYHNPKTILLTIHPYYGKLI